MSYNPSTPAGKLDEPIQVKREDTGSEGNDEEKKPDMMLQRLQELEEENPEGFRTWLLSRLQNMSINKHESSSEEKGSGDEEDDEAEEQSEAEEEEDDEAEGQHAQPILDLSELQVDWKDYVNNIGSLEKLLENSDCLHAAINRAGILQANVRMRGSRETCSKVNIRSGRKLCRYCWDPTRCDCKEKNIVFMAQCLECEKKYAPKTGNDVFLDQFQIIGNGIYIGYTTSKSTSGRFRRLINVASEPLMQHWHNVHPTLPEPNKKKLYKFLGIYQGLYLTQVCDAMEKIFKASIVPPHYGKEEDNEAEDPSSDN